CRAEMSCLVRLAQWRIGERKQLLCVERRVCWQACQRVQCVQLWQVCACCSEYSFRLILQRQALLVSQCRYPRMQGRRLVNPGWLRCVKRDRLPENGELAQQLVELQPVLAPVVTHAMLFMMKVSLTTS